jgi:hypothetical protein
MTTVFPEFTGERNGRIVLGGGHPCDKQVTAGKTASITTLTLTAGQTERSELCDSKCCNYSSW